MTGIASLVEDLVGLGPGGAVGGLDDHLGLDVPGVLGREHAAEGGGDEHVDRGGQELVVGSRLAPLEANDLAMSGDVLVECGDVDALGMEEGAIGVGDGDDLGSLLVGGTARCSRRRCRNPEWRWWHRPPRGPEERGLRG